MTRLKALGNQTTSVERVSEGNDITLKALRDGTLTVASWVAALSLAGRVFTVNQGLGTTAKAFGDGGLDTDEFDLHVAVPSGVVIIPLELFITFEEIGTAGILETVMQSGSGSVTGSGDNPTPISSNVSSGRASKCTVTGSAATGATALTTNIKEIWRDMDQLAIDIDTVAQIRVKYNYRWYAMDTGVLDVVGPNQQVAIWAAATAGTGQIGFKYIELPVAAVE